VIFFRVFQNSHLMEVVSLLL